MNMYLAHTPVQELWCFDRITLADANVNKKTAPKNSGGVLSGGSGVVLCSWCGRVCTSGGRRGTSAFQLPTTSGDRHFCSEVCFTQCRRASFKKSKVCDWCRHVRPTVTYVDFTDGDHQLQFCSDKCLNQYKMQIFCRETEAHLQMHPHLNDLKPASSSGLITPDLWLRDCSQNSEVDSGPEGDNQIESPTSPAPATSPSASSEPTEPVNLSTQANTRGDSHRLSPPLGRRSPLSMRHTSSRASEVLSPGPPPAPRYGRPRLRDRRESLRDVGRPRSVRASLQLAHTANHDTDKLDEQIRLPAIRVRQLEAPQQQDQVPIDRDMSDSIGLSGDNSNEVSSPHPSSQPPALSLGGLGGGLGGLLPMVGGAPLLMPHMLPPDLPRTPLLPHLLLQHPELLRPPPLRHPLLQAPPAPAPPTPAPPTVPPPAPGQVKVQKSLLPPVTVLIPCPIPIPIPIPIPFPLPVPITNKTEGTESRPTVVPAKETVGRHRTTPRKESNRAGSVITGPIGASGNSNSSNSQSITAAAQPNPPPTTSSSSSSESERNTLPRPDRERRSILRYTSDVYEINGMFLPKDSTWEAPEPLHLRRALVGESGHAAPYEYKSDFDSHGISRSPSPETREDSKEALSSLTKMRDEDSNAPKKLLDEENDINMTGADTTKFRSSTPTTISSPSSSSGRKRHTTSEHQQPLPKKKHLLV
ncbi:hypothetical protein SK128_020730 [Halocaridina rubra]|uniref:Sine oculis-binding protein-like protein n=1 Tax=Halocaridina rubra TaxID=373956 RepID=A0AAN8XBR4_HALRR